MMLLSLVACSSQQATQTASSSPEQKPSPKNITTAELAKLKWIEGSWKGTGDIDKPFYERYKFENDTTLLVETFPDEKFEKASESDRFELKNGEFGKFVDGGGSVAIALDDNSVTFAPRSKGNIFKFQRETPDTWKAILTWRDANGNPKERNYLMTRIAK